MLVKLCGLIWLATISAAFAQTATTPTDAELQQAWETCLRNHPPVAHAQAKWDADPGCVAIRTERKKRWDAQNAAEQQHLQSVIQQLGK